MRFREFKNEKSPRADAITDDPDAEIDESDVADPLTAATDAAGAEVKRLQDRKKRQQIQSKQKQAQKLRTDLAKKESVKR